MDRVDIFEFAKYFSTQPLTFRGEDTEICSQYSFSHFPVCVSLFSREIVRAELFLDYIFKRKIFLKRDLLWQLQQPPRENVTVTKIRVLSRGTSARSSQPLPSSNSIRKHLILLNIILRILNYNYK